MSGVWFNLELSCIGPVSLQSWHTSIGVGKIMVYTKRAPVATHKTARGAPDYDWGPTIYGTCRLNAQVPPRNETDFQADQVVHKRQIQHRRPLIG